ncbi:unnamed protein product, partial [Rotaria magnacalcarata]
PRARPWSASRKRRRNNRRASLNADSNPFEIVSNQYPLSPKSDILVSS